MNYIILTPTQMADVVGQYQEGSITREIIPGRLMPNGNYALDAVLLNSSADDLVNKLKELPIEDLNEADFVPVSIR